MFDPGGAILPPRPQFDCAIVSSGGQGWPRFSRPPEGLVLDGRESDCTLAVSGRKTCVAAKHGSSPRRSSRLPGSRSRVSTEVRELLSGSPSIISISRPSNCLVLLNTWTDDEIDQYRAHWPLGTQQRLVMEFALETASRRGEVVRLGPQHVKNGRIRIERTHGSNDVDIPMSPELQAACDAMPKAHLTYIVTAYGKPRSKYGLGNDFAKWATEAGAPAHCRKHGLKKGGMRRLAEAGGTAHELMAISGHRTLSEVQRYTEDANRKLLADTGMAKKRTPGEQASG